jgi:tyrosyl-tRNA synthetase
MNLFEEFQWRGMVAEVTDGVAEALAKERVTAYIGFDPTASSLHVGNMLTVMGLARLQKFGHTPIAIVGGGTGMIGDPSGKSQERNLLSAEQIAINVAGVRAQLERFLDFHAATNAAQIINNADWLGAIDLLTYLRDVGKHFTVNYMLQKESVSRRIESADGISYTEFSYLVLQAFDYLQLFDRHHCTLQMGGTDQWGNITAGIELIRKVRGQKAHGLVWPLMKTAAGTKFGKTEAGTVWLDPQRTSPFRFYQFFLNTDDRDVIGYLKAFTWLDRPMIGALEKTVTEAPEQREAQRTLAREVTTMVHGTGELEKSERASQVLFGGSLADASVDDILMVFDDVPSVEMSAAALTAMSNSALVAHVGLAASKGEAGRLIKQGGIYLGDRRLTDDRAPATLDDSIGGKVMVLRKGQRDRRIVKIV